MVFINPQKVPRKKTSSNITFIVDLETDKITSTIRSN